ncbi:cytochrome P450 [Glutamicibacter mishrai]|uniref:Cytochrome P450 n=1 Tax=Glutamicibacter mishrai TaxID=1775880 RepID=A0A6H0SN97_9MICC|nr:cytochrome P450 [Glutamicibacter mishrai]QIV87909.1 cytochrome P450 [Glutamicibacter mishrai]
MTCPFAATSSALADAPLAGELSMAYPEAINARYQCIEDPHTVRAILARPEVFSPANALTTAVELDPAALRILARARFALPEVLASASGPAHLAVRRIVARFFSPSKVRAQSEPILTRVREICSGLELRLRTGESVDLVTELATVIPVEVMSRLTGLPVPDPGMLKTWSQDSLELFWGWPDAQRQLILAKSAAQYFRWLEVSVHQAVPRDDGNLYATLHRAGVAESQIRSLAYFLGIAGQETTSMLIQTALYTALHDHPWSELSHADTAPASAQKLIREVLARASSVPTWRRVATSDVRIGEFEFKAGEQLVLRLSGGQLGAVGDDSLAFGYGVHRCLGAALARMESELVLAETARCLPSIVLAGPSTPFTHLLSFQAPTTVPVKYPAERIRP